MSSEHKNLNHYFEAARAQEPLVPLTELKESLSQAPAGAGSGRQASAVAGKTFIFWTTGVLSLLVVSALLWHLFLVNTEASEQVATGEGPLNNHFEGLASQKELQPRENDSALLLKGIPMKVPETTAVIQKSLRKPANEKGVSPQTSSASSAKRRLALSSGVNMVELQEGQKTPEKNTLQELSRDVEQGLRNEEREKVNFDEKLFDEQDIKSSFKIGSNEWPLHSSIIANESFGATSKFEIDLISGEEELSNAKTLIWLSVTSNSTTDLAEGTYQFSSIPLHKRPPFHFHGKVATQGNELRVTGGTFSIRKGKKNSLIYFVVELENGAVATGGYSGRVSVINRSKK